MGQLDSCGACQTAVGLVVCRGRRSKCKYALTYISLVMHIILLPVRRPAEEGDPPNHNEEFAIRFLSHTSCLAPVMSPRRLDSVCVPEGTAHTSTHDFKSPPSFLPLSLCHRRSNVSKWSRDDKVQMTCWSRAA